VAVFAVGVSGMPQKAHAQSAAYLQSQIDDHNSQIKKLEAEIASYQKELDTLGTQKNTLQSTVNTLTISQKQLASKIQVTEANIAWANKRIGDLTISIGDKEASIQNAQTAIAAALQDMAEGDREELVSILVTSKSLSDAWKAADASLQFSAELKKNIASLRSARVVLSTNRDAVNKEKETLVSLQHELQLEKRSVDASKVAQQQLLAQTKNQEANYQSLIAQKKAAEKSFEDQLVVLQSQLNLIVNPGSLPKVGSGILVWPFSRAFMASCADRKAYFGNLFCITQYFGNTPFATANAQVYNGHGHNAIDIAAPVGTPILAALAGTVLDTGNTDLARGCYSFGKWVMVKHANGISTLYSHLSTIDVSAGQAVGAGQLLGLSGMTGFATGPHLHFGVYASEGTRIQTLQQFRGASGGCASVKMPVATLTAYLNPMSYL
jgi:murein DD-endopeptidase MepM/ murein hydrolase activator NlpD